MVEAPLKLSASGAAEGAMPFLRDEVRLKVSFGLGGGRLTKMSSCVGEEDQRLGLETRVVRRTSRGAAV